MTDLRSEESPEYVLDVAGPSEVTRVLVVTAHPDDVDFGTAGSVATWTQRGIAVTYCIVTSGEAGGSDLSMPRSEMAALREAEQRSAAKEVGVEDVRFLGHPDGRVVASLALRRDISRVIRQVRPDRVVCQSPERNWERIYASHPDHLAAGEATVAAVYPDARNPFAHTELLDEEGLEPHAVPELWVMFPGSGNRVVDITDAFDKKVAALRSHASQVGDGSHLEPMLREWSAALARQAGLPEERLAEAFRVTDTR